MVLDFTNVNLIPSKLKVKLKNCIHIIRNFHFRFYDLYKEKNTCVERLTNVGFFVDDLVFV